MKTRGKARTDWLNKPESDEPLPDFVERDLEKPFEIDLSAWEAEELSPDFAERVVRALSKKRLQGNPSEEADSRPATGREAPSTSPRPVAKAEGVSRAQTKRHVTKAGPRAASSARPAAKKAPDPFFAS